MMLSVSNLCKSYHGKPVLRNVSFTADVGLTHILGPSGIGKTTLLRILLGLETPDSGSVQNGLRWAAVFQEDRLLPALDAAGNLRFALGPAYGESGAMALLAELGLASAGRQPIAQYSGGMRRRLALARALLAHADAIALDEPFTGLDAENAEAAMRCILRAAQEKIVLLVAHEPIASLPSDCASVSLAPSLL